MAQVAQQQDMSACFFVKCVERYLKPTGTIALGTPYASMGRRRFAKFRTGIYGDDHLLKDLPSEHQYLWVRYQPIPDQGYGGYPLDWTHEREWRARIRPYNYFELGPGPSEGVPLFLPPVNVYGGFHIVFPKVLVKTVAESIELKHWVQQQPLYKGPNQVIARYFEMLTSVDIVPLDLVEDRVNHGDQRWSRLETLPVNEIEGCCVDYLATH